MGLRMAWSWRIMLSTVVLSTWPWAAGAVDTIVEAPRAASGLRLIDVGNPREDADAEWPSTAAALLKTGCAGGRHTCCRVARTLSGAALPGSAADPETACRNRFARPSRARPRKTGAAAASHKALS